MTQQTMSEREMYLASFEREYQTTLKVLRAYPAEQSELKPAPSCKSARELGFMLALGQMVPGMVAAQDAILEAKAPPAPATWAEVLGAFEHGHAASVAVIQKMSEAEYNAPFRLASGPGGQTTTMRRADALWFFASDQVHHRGQFSIYLRMAGGKVPSIYGPSGDQPW